MRALVTGGGGFLGGHIAARLHGRGDRVTVLGRSQYPHLKGGIATIQCDLRVRQDVFDSLKGQDAVFHAAAFAGIWGDYEHYHAINVQGTRHVIDACREHAVKKLIFTSSPSVVFGDSGLEGVDESLPYPESYLCHYPRTKAEAERMVMQADGVDGLSTVCLRPHLIWGVGDPHLVPRILDRARKGRLIRVGEGKNRVDMIHVENAAQAHIQACDALRPDSSLAGQCYFVSDGEPVNLWDWINRLLTALGRPKVTRSLSYRSARVLGGVLEMLYGALNIKSEPPMTRFVAAQLATSHYFNISKARKDFHYTPVISQEEGMRQLIASLRAHPEH